MVILIVLGVAVAASFLMMVVVNVFLRQQSPSERRATAARWERGLSAMGKAESAGWNPRRRR
jgi:NADH:ubiquinone oxidoreductase subunit 3 (subunit A)